MSAQMPEHEDGGTGARRPMPVLIALGIGFAWFFVALSALAILMAAIDAAFLGGQGQYRIDDREVSPGEFLRTGAILFAAASTALGTIAIGLQGRRPWSRYAILAFWIANASYAIGSETSRANTLAAAVTFGALLVFSAGYLFRKRNIVAYFRDAPAIAGDEPRSALRPTGLTLLALALGWLSVAALLNATAIAAGWSRLHAGIGVAAALYGVTAAVAAAGLWRLEPWAPRAFAAWALSVLLTLLVFPLSIPIELALGGVWGVVGFGIGTAILLVFLHRYVRSALASVPASGVRPAP